MSPGGGATGAAFTTAGAMAGQNASNLTAAALGAAAEGLSQASTPGASQAAVSGANNVGEAARQGVEQLQNVSESFVPIVHEEAE